MIESPGSGWQQLAKFNWATDKPVQINKYLKEKVGCTHLTQDRNYMFNDSDEPGIVYIPELVTIEGLAEDEEHILRVKPSVDPSYRFSI